MRTKLILFSLLLYLLVQQTTSLTAWESASAGLFAFFLLDLVYCFGNRMVFLHFFIVLAFLQWLIMPIFSYHIFNGTNYTAILWDKVMEVPSDTYYAYILPGTLAMIAGFKFPIRQAKNYKNTIVYIKQAQKQLVGKSSTGWLLLGIGLLFSSVGFLAGGGNLANIMFLLRGLVYVGILYLYFSDFQNKRILWGILIAFEGVNSLKSGMFGGSLFLFITLAIVIGTEWKLSLATKITGIVVGFAFVVFLQSVKGEYRALTWTDSESAGLGTFNNLVANKIEDRSSLISEHNLFFLVLRFNNGWQISRTLNRVPAKYPYANGESIALSLAAAVAPRFLWADKPTSGGKANLERFWGESYGKTAMNISPIGEAYANFGTTGGIIFMFFFGLLLNWSVMKVLFWVEKRPTIICWFPLIFYSFYGVETDILSILNSMLKGIIFTYLFILLYKYATGKQL